MTKKYSKYVAYLFIALFAVNPLIFWPWAKIAYEIPKVWFIIRYIEILGVALLFFPTRLSKEKKDFKMYALVLAFLSVIFLTSIFGEDFNKSLWGNYYRQDGLFTYLHLIILAFIASALFKKTTIKQLFTGVLIGLVIVCSITILNAVLYIFTGLNIPNWNGAIGGTFGNPNFLSGYLVITLPVIWYFISNEKFLNRKILYCSFLFMQLISILLTKSWAGIIGIILFANGVLIIKNQKKLALLFLSMLSLISIGYFYLSNSQYPDSSKVFVAEARTRIFTKGILAFEQKPLFGYGWANFDSAFDSIDWPMKFENDVYVDKAHSTFLEVLITTGLVGTILYLLIICRVFINLGKIKLQDAKYLVFILILYLIHSQMNVISISEEIFFWLLIGISTNI